jgi:hypothetical protein
MTNHNSVVAIRIISVPIFVDGVDDIGGPRRWKSMDYHVVKQVRDKDFSEFRVVFENIIVEVLHVTRFV